MNTKDKLSAAWINKIVDGEKLTVSDLLPFSKINLRKARNKKKFLKHYYRYVTTEVGETYMGCLFVTPLVGLFKRQAEFKLDPIEPIYPAPKVKLVYFDYEFPTEKNEIQ